MNLAPLVRQESYKELIYIDLFNRLAVTILMKSYR